MMNEKTRALAEQIETSINTLATETDAVNRARKKAVSKRSEYTRRLSV